jgi:hypothetical protein
MMEYLLFLQPFFLDLSVITFFCSVAALTMSAIVWFFSNAEYSGCEKEETMRKASRKLKKVGLILAIALVPLFFLANIWNGYKLQMVHRVATSDTSEKAVENINKLLDVLSKRLDEELGE